MNVRESLEYFQKLQPEMLDQLAQWVEIESPTTDKAAVNRLGTDVAAKLSQIGMSIEIHKAHERGDHLVARWGNPDNKVLILGHLDTVWEPGTLQRMPVKVDGDVASGPGVFDMKGGIVVTLFALRLLHEQGIRGDITLLLDSDEEEGSYTSRELIELEAKTSRCTFVLEPAGPGNSLKTKRRGTGHYAVTAHGKAAHAGVEPEKGINAITELSHQILEIQSWNAARKGISAHVGIAHGGTRTNVIPEWAEAIVDVRCDTLQDKEWLENQFRMLTPKHPQARIELKGGFERPPLERSEKNLALYREAAAIAAQFNYPVSEYWTGGASDGNFTSALGIPTLDGLGPEGGGAHAVNEHILISSLAKRANLLYQLLGKRIRA